MCAVEMIPHLTAFASRHPQLASVIGRKRRLEDPEPPRPLEHEHDHLGHVLGGHHPRQDVLGPPAALVERELGRDAARADVRAADPVLPQLAVERAREADLAELRRAVDRLVRQPAPARLGGERDHVALAARACAAALRGSRRASPSGSRRSSRRGARARARGTARTRRLPRSRRRCRSRRNARPRRGRTRRARPGRARPPRSPSRRRGPRSSPARETSPRFTPRSWNIRATAAPMPRLAPVITAVFPSRLMRPPVVEVRDRAHLKRS